MLLLFCLAGRNQFFPNTGFGKPLVFFLILKGICKQFEGKEKFHSFKPAPRRSTLKDTIFQSFYENKLRLLWSKWPLPLPELTIGGGNGNCPYKLFLGSFHARFSGPFWLVFALLTYEEDDRLVDELGRLVAGLVHTVRLVGQHLPLQQEPTAATTQPVVNHAGSERLFLIT